MFKILSGPFVLTNSACCFLFCCCCCCCCFFFFTIIFWWSVVGTQTSCMAKTPSASRLKAGHDHQSTHRKTSRERLIIKTLKESTLAWRSIVSRRGSTTTSFLSNTASTHATLSFPNTFGTLRTATPNSQSIVTRARSYRGNPSRWNLCLMEKLCILSAERSTLLNRRSEWITKNQIIWRIIRGGGGQGTESR